VNMVETEGVEEFLANAAHTKLTAVPQGNLIICTKADLPLLQKYCRMG
jgi:hypothetical protein